MGTFQPWHILVVAVVGAFLFFGWKNLPEMARSAGRSMRVFKTEIKGMGDDDKAREANDTAAAEPKQLAPRPAAPQPRVAPQATVVTKTVVTEAVTPEQPVRSRPRPTPSPNGHARRG